MVAPNPEDVAEVDEFPVEGVSTRNGNLEWRERGRTASRTGQVAEGPPGQLKPSVLQAGVVPRAPSEAAGEGAKGTPCLGVFPADPGSHTCSLLGSISRNLGTHWQWGLLLLQALEGLRGSG